MTRARTLANYVSGGTTAAEFDYLDGVTSNLQTQLDAKSPTTGHASIATVGTVTSGTWQGTTVAVNQGGTGAATHTANNVMIGAGTSALTSIAPGADGQVLTSTGSVWNSEAAAGGGRMKELDDYWTDAAVNDASEGLTDFNISGAYYITVTPDATTDLLEWSYNFNCWGADARSGSHSSSSTYLTWDVAPAAMGWGLERDDNTSFSSPTNFWRNGQHTIQWSAHDNHYANAGGTFVLTAAECGMSADATYYVRLTGASSTTDSNNTWGASGPQENEGRGVRLLMKRWSAS